MARSLWAPEIFEQVIGKKKQQLEEIESKLHGLPLDDPSRPKLLEEMFHLQQTIPELEAEYARKTAADSTAPGGVATAEWEKITPAPLLPAIKHIRNSFRSNALKCSEVTERLCFAALHSDADKSDLTPYETALVAYRKIIGIAAVQEFDGLLQVQTPPAIFKAYLDIYRKGLEVNIRDEFKKVLEIALANRKSLEAQPVEWSKTHLRLFLSNHLHMVTMWIKRVCDKQDYRSDSSEDLRERAAWTSWRAPKLIHMQPSGNTPYDSANAWTREDQVETHHLLESLSNLFIEFASFTLDRAAGDAHVALAATPGHAEVLVVGNAGNQKPSTTSDVVQRAKLEAELADLGDEIRALDQRRDLSKGQALFRKSHLQHKQNKVSVQIEILNYTRELAQCERALDASQRRYQQTQTPEGLKILVRHEVRRQSGHLDGGTHRPIQPWELLTPQQRVIESAKSGVANATEALRRVQDKLDRANEKLVELRALDQDWELSGTAQHVESRPRPTAPEPPSRVGGRGEFIGPKATQPLFTTPAYYPNQLVPRTAFVVTAAVRKFPLQTQILDLCKDVIVELTRDFVAAVESNKDFRPDLALSAMEDLLDSILAQNCDDPSQRVGLAGQLRKCDEWMAFLAEMAKPIEGSDESSDGPGDQLEPMNPDPAAWTSIEISFTSDHRVQVRNGTNNETLNYADFGFADGRNKNPNRAWASLLELARGRGIIREPGRSSRTWSQVEKRIQEIRRLLKRYFYLSSDPIPFIQGVGYQARFKIGCGPSVET
jgi:hypothetical protein